MNIVNCTNLFFLLVSMVLLYLFIMLLIKYNKSKKSEESLQNSEENLQYKLRFEKMLSDISFTFVSKSAENINEAIDHALRLSGEFFKIDRSYVFQFSDDGESMENTHWWCTGEIEPQMEWKKNFFMRDMPWVIKQIKDKKFVHIPDVNLLSPELDAEKKEFQFKDIKSMLLIPMVKDGTYVTGFLGFDAVKEKKIWTEEEKLLLAVITGIISGVLIKQHTEEALQASEERYRILVENANEAIVVNQDGMHKFVNPMAVEIFGCDEDGLKFVPFDKFVHPKYLGMVKEHYAKIIRGKMDREKYNIKINAGDGSIKWVEISAVSIEWEGKPAVLSLISDITERKNYEEQLTYLSFHDQLTGLYNRAYFEEELNRLSCSREYPITIMSADVDGLKLINDTLGHEKGDELLKSCAGVLKESLRQSDILVRIGGDEFVVVLPRTDKKKGEEIEERIRTQVALYNKKSTHLSLSISIGIDTAENERESLKEIYKKADDLMYRDKMLNKSSTRRQMMETLLAAPSERDYLTSGHS